MNGITKQTRRQSYDGIRTRSGERCKLILETLGNRSMTVEEITDELVAAGHLKYYDREAVTIMASNIVNTQQGTFSDDGVSQQAIIKTGVTTKDAAFVPNPVSLIPYRTFLEVPQPASDFVFRISEGRGGAPAFKLVAADGGLWKSQAVDNVKNYLVKALADVPDREKITIIA